jgi:hypothetical protein
MNRCVLALSICSFAACSSGGSTKTTQLVGVNGGLLAASDGTSLTVPPGAVAADTTFTIEAATTAPTPSGVATVAPIYAFRPEGAQFSKPVTVTLPFDASKLPFGKTAADIKILTAPAGSSSYTALPTVVVGNAVQAPTFHFSVFTAAVPDSTVPPPPADMAVPPLGASDMAFSDMALGTCVPSCNLGSGGCNCTGSCSGKSYSMTCSQPTVGAAPTCRCDVNGQTMTGKIDSCSVQLMQTEFMTLCKFPGPPN